MAQTMYPDGSIILIQQQDGGTAVHSFKDMEEAVYQMIGNRAFTGDIDSMAQAIKLETLKRHIERRILHINIERCKNG